MLVLDSDEQILWSGLEQVLEEKEATVRLIRKSDIPISDFHSIRVGICRIKENGNSRITRLRLMKQNEVKQTSSSEDNESELVCIPEVSDAILFLQKKFALTPVLQLDKFLRYHEQLSVTDDLTSVTSDQFINQALKIMTQSSSSESSDSMINKAISPGHAILLYTSCISEALRSIHLTVRDSQVVKSTKALELLKVMRVVHPGLADALIVHQVYTLLPPFSFHFSFINCFDFIMLTFFFPF